MEIIFTVWLLCGLFGALIGQSKNRKLQGLLLGFCLGIIGLIILVFLPEREEGVSSSCVGWAFAFLLIVLFLASGGLFLIDKVRESQKKGQTDAGPGETAGRNAEQERKPGWELTWDRIEKQDIGPRYYYLGVIQHRFSGNNYLVRCATRTRADSGPVGDYVLVDLPDSTMNVNDTIAFFARVAGRTSFDTLDGKRREVVRLVYEPPDEPARSGQDSYQNPLSKKAFRN